MLTSVGRWTIEHEPDATAKHFAEQAIGSDCDCIYCKNFASALDHAFPASFRALANELGIDVSKYAELCHWDRESSGLYFTGGWFHLVGDIKEGRDAWKNSSGSSIADFEEWQDNIRLGFSKRLSLLPHPCDPNAFLQLEFETRVPWVLDEPEPTWRES